MKINGNEIKPGNIIQHNDAIWVAVKTSHVKPGKGGAFAQVEFRRKLWRYVAAPHSGSPTRTPTDHPTVSPTRPPTPVPTPRPSHTPSNTPSEVLQL